MKRLLAICLCGFIYTALGATYQEQAVAAVLMGEAGSEGVRGMTAVADVIHQRAIQKDWTPLHVVSAHRGYFHAFSCLNGTTLDRLIRKFSRERDFQKALHIARLVCQNPARLPHLVNAANHYTNVTAHPDWARDKRPVALIGRLAFYKLKH